MAEALHLAPEGVDPKAWQLFAIFVATIVGLILQPVPMGAVVLIGVTLSALTGTLSITEALTGDHHFEQAGYVALLK